MADPFSPAPAERRVFCNRTLNLRTIKAIGFDMDYTLIHYRPEVWEQSAYDHLKARLLDNGWPVAELTFDPQFVILGLVLDLEKGNILKANRFGYVHRAFHGTRELSFDDMRNTYGRTLVDLSEPRWLFLNTLFSLSEGVMYAQLVDLLDAEKLHKPLSYPDLYRAVKAGLDHAHMEGALKAEIVGAPERFVVLDPDLPLCLLDLKYAGKKLLLITNSEWDYTRPMMAYAFDRFLPEGMTWRELFDVKIVAARKPTFFSQRNPVFEIVNEEGLLRPLSGKLRTGGTYLGGHAGMVEEHLQLDGQEILYVGDHIYADVHVSKNLLRWRTALVLRDLEDELHAIESFKDAQAQLSARMADKQRLEHRFSVLRLQVQRLEAGYGPRPSTSAESLRASMQELRAQLVQLDNAISPLARAHAALANPRWGLLTRTGNDKSHLARQIERHADIYTSRVSNLLYETPFVYLRAPRGSLPHDSGKAGGVEAE